ncbi:IMP cyclohydrolase [Natrialba sp. SSL1]|uniref:IMP cyclohydrolase n=1 Tax=Natrialba sp. SSL1 TaxID=1869245 RepID=UPI0008F7ED28|nr:IMP cyclohydrolase [Natrialba sp. SSL1]OIB55549.1 IMP cyclohydrolase [Natrialba sp. SSL1]
MYVGRFVVVGPEGGAYRVSSRSFPNRAITARDDAEALTVGPTEDAPDTDNPYVSYNCLRVVETPTGETVAFGNGSHVDPIAEKLELGYPARDALAESLLALDYEKDNYDTPRIAATITDDGEALIGTVRKDALLVETVDEPTLVATYEKDAPEPIDFDAESAAAAASESYALEYEHAVCAAGVVRTENGFETAIENGD